MRQKTGMVFALALMILLTLCGCSKGAKYEKAQAMLSEAKYEEAIAAFEALEGYEQSESYAAYAKAVRLAEQGMYAEAAEAMAALGSFQDSSVLAAEYHEKDLSSRYIQAQTLLAGKKYDEAAAAFEALEGYEQSESYAAYAKAVRLAEQGMYAEAAEAMAALGSFQDSSVLAAEYHEKDLSSRYIQAQTLLAGEQYEEAIELFSGLGNYEDSSIFAMYAKSLKLAEEGSYALASKAFETLLDFKDSRLLAVYYRARGLEAKKNHEEAAEVYSQILTYRDSMERYLAQPDLALTRDFEALAGQWEQSGHWLAWDESTLPEETDSLLRSAEKEFAKRYSDSDTRFLEQAYVRGEKWLADGDAYKAGEWISLLVEAGYPDSRNRLPDCVFAIATQIMDGEFDYDRWLLARDCFEYLEDYPGAAEKLTACNYQIALSDAENGRIADAYAGLSALGDYMDAADRVRSYDAQYASAKAQMEAGNYEEAAAIMTELNDLWDCKALLEICDQEMGNYHLTASAYGMFGDVTAEITTYKGRIVDVKLTGEYETPSLGGRALEEMPARIIAAQSPNVDGVSGATATSRAVRIAVTNALWPVGLLEGEVYTGSAEGFGGEVTAEITVSGSVIVDVKLTGENETPGFGATAVEELPARILEAQSTEFDGWTGATFTSNAVRKALADAMKQAGLVLKLKLKKTNVTIGKKGVYITLELENGLSAEDVKWTSSDSSVATVWNGNVTAMGRGMCVITAEYKGQTDKCIVRVTY